MMGHRWAWMTGRRGIHARGLGPAAVPALDASGRPLTPLSDLPAGAHAVVRSLRCRGGLSARVAALGVTPGAAVTVIQNYGHGPMLIAVRDTAVAIGRGEALKIEVEGATAGAGE